MKIPNFRRLYKGDYKQDEQGLIEKLSYTVNSGFESIYEALNKRLTFDDNFNGNIVTFSVKVGANGVPAAQTSIRTTVSGTVAGLIPINVVNTTSSTGYPTATPFISFSQNSNIININNITGLQTNNNYQITVIVIGT